MLTYIIKTDLNHAENSSPARFFASSGPAINRNNKRGRHRKNHMNRLILRFQKVTLLRLIVFALGCIMLLPTAQAVSPPPEGAYPNFTTAVGQNALLNLTSGTGNSGLGALTLFTDSTGSFNTAVGAGALLFNNSGLNTAVGAEALLSNTNGTANTATGLGTLFSNAIGDSNTANGAFALFGNTTVVNNTAIGDGALQSNTTGNGNIALGESAGGFLTTGDNNIEIGNLGVAGESNKIRIGDPTIHTGIFLAGIVTMNPEAPNQAILLDPTTGQRGARTLAPFHLDRRGRSVSQDLKDLKAPLGHKVLRDYKGYKALPVR